MAMNAVVDERTLREIYLTGFEIAVSEGHPGALMTSYNQVNGSYANENTHLLQDILRGEWGYDGLVITDWSGSNDHVEGVRAGSDLEMPNPGMDSARQLVEAVKSGRLPEAAVDACAARLLRAALTLTQNQHPAKWNQAAHHLLAYRAAAESAVLFKNQDSLLPLHPHTRVAVIGDFAFTPRYQGAGSSMVNATQVDKMADLRDEGMGIDELAAWTEEHKREVQHWFFSSDLTFFVRGGRISKAAGLVGGMLKICPVMDVEPDGSLAVKEKIRTKAKAVNRVVEKMEELAEGGLDYSGKCFISQSECIDDAQEVARRIEAKFPKLNGKVEIFPIGATIGVHTGPGTVALFFWGEKRA